MSLMPVSQNCHFIQ